MRRRWGDGRMSPDGNATLHLRQHADVGIAADSSGAAGATIVAERQLRHARRLRPPGLAPALHFTLDVLTPV